LLAGCWALLPRDSPDGVFSASRIIITGAHRFAIPVRDLLLATAFHSPGPAFAFANSIPGSPLPACRLLPVRLPYGPFGGSFCCWLKFPKTLQLPLPPVSAGLCVRGGRFFISATLWGLDLPPDHDVI
jgi:hypothetical protein